MADPFVGEIRLFAGTYAPQGWLACDGSQIQISENEILFTLLGTTYGGDGVRTFALPDLRNRLPVGQGTGPALSPRTMGQTFGAASVPLTQAQLPAHSHTIQGSADNATTGIPGPTTVLATLASGTLYDSGVPNPTLERNLSPQSIPVVGGSVPHSNLMPTTALNYIIATVGIYPQQA